MVDHHCHSAFTWLFANLGLSRPTSGQISRHLNKRVCILLSAPICIATLPNFLEFLGAARTLLVIFTHLKQNSDEGMYVCVCILKRSILAIARGVESRHGAALRCVAFVTIKCCHGIGFLSCLLGQGRDLSPWRSLRRFSLCMCIHVCVCVCTRMTWVSLCTFTKGH